MSKCQNAKLLAALERRAMTAVDIWQELGIARASARIYDLRSAGHVIQSQDITVKNRDGEPCRVALYSIAEPGREAAHP